MLPLIISGPSGVGKSSICQILLKERPRLQNCISTTTRTIRYNEKQGIHYNFISRESFIHKLENNEFIEHQQIFDNHYGILKSDLLRIQQNGKIGVFEIDIEGAKIIKKQFNGHCVFVVPKYIGQIKQRLIDRNTESRNSLQSRIRKGRQEIMVA